MKLFLISWTAPKSPVFLIRRELTQLDFCRFTYIHTTLCHPQIFCPFTLFPYFSFNLNQFLLHHVSHSPVSCSQEINSSQVEFTELKGAGQSSATHWRVQQDSYLSPVLYLIDGKLHRNVETVQNVASKHQCVFGSVDSMNPPLITEKSTRNL